MRVLVTGGLGTLGVPLVQALRTEHLVQVADLRHPSRCDISEYRQLERLIEDFQPEFVYHLAAEFGRNNGEDYYEQCWKHNAIGTKNLIRLQEKHRFKVIFTSSSEVYGEMGSDLLSEGLTSTNPVSHYNDYAMSKWVNEQQFRNSIAVHNTETMILRLFNAYGPGEHYHPYRSVVCLFIHNALNKKPYTVYEGYHRVFMYVDDLIKTLSGCMENFYPGEVINVGGEEYRSVKEVSDMILEQLDLPDDKVIYLPKEAMNVVNKRPDIRKARALLGHDPKTPLEFGIPKTVDWMRAP